MLEISGSFRTSGKSTSISHNNRDVDYYKKTDKYHQHIQWERTSENITLEKKSIKEVYKELFDEDVEKYNSKQKRKDRKIDDYYFKVKNDGSLDLQREFIVQIGDKNLAEKYDIEDALIEKLTDYHFWFKREFPDLKIYNSVIHLDEATPHLHINVVPVANGYKKGMTKRPSFSKWLKNNNFEFKDFRAMQSKKLTELIRSLGAERKKVGTHEYMKPNQYREIMQEAEKILTEAEKKETWHILNVNKLQSKANDLESLIEYKKTELDSLRSQIEPFEDNIKQLKSEFDSKNKDLYWIDSEKELLEAELGLLKAEKEVLDEIKPKYLTIEPQMKNEDVQHLINNSKNGFGGLKGITLEALMSIGKVVKQLFETVTWMRNYIKQLEFENKKLKEPRREQFNSFEKRVSDAREKQVNLNHIPKNYEKSKGPRR